MLDWLARNSDILNVALNAAMLGVWIAYLQIFASSYRRQTRANIMVNMGGGSGLDARCLVSNMSASPIYLQSIFIGIQFADRRLIRPVTETEGFEEWDKPTDLNLWTRQGPLNPGEVRDMGAFGIMLDHALRSETGGKEPEPGLRDGIQALEVRIVAVYGSEDLPVAAERRFALVCQEDTLVLSPFTAQARQVRSRSRRRRMLGLLEAELGEAQH
jgi:hypothetical protein